MIYIGIDPGKDGAIAIIPENDMYLNDIKIYHFEDDYIQIIKEIHNHCSQCICYMERVHALPGNGVKQAFAFGENYGYIRGILESFLIPYQTVPPQTWKKEFSLDSDKQHSIQCAKQLFPGVDLKRTQRCKTEHDGKAEALLLAEYARRKYARHKH